jgi:signal peptidase I
MKQNHSQEGVVNPAVDRNASSSGKASSSKSSEIAKEIRSLLGIILLAVGLRTFIAEPFGIPSGSMIPSLLIGDYLYVAKYEYGYSNYSLPFSPNLFKGRIFERRPKSGEVAVFMGENMEESRTFVGKFFEKIWGPSYMRYIKRVIGVPGDTVEIKKGIVFINGIEAKQRRIEDFVERTATGRLKHTPQYIETLPNGKEHILLREDPEGLRPEDNMGPYQVPEDQYFMMGDNRNHSGDSRFSYMGYIPLERFIGPAKFTFFSVDSNIWDIWKVFEWPEIIRGSRIFKWIQ